MTEGNAWKNSNKIQIKFIYIYKALRQLNMQKRNELANVVNEFAKRQKRFLLESNSNRVANIIIVSAGRQAIKKLNQANWINKETRYTGRRKANKTKQNCAWNYYWRKTHTQREREGERVWLAEGEGKLVGKVKADAHNCFSLFNFCQYNNEHTMSISLHHVSLSHTLRGLRGSKGGRRGLHLEKSLPSHILLVMCLWHKYCIK